MQRVKKAGPKGYTKKPKPKPKKPLTKFEILMQAAKKAGKL
jgi:hypothetical protein